MMLELWMYQYRWNGLWYEGYFVTSYGLDANYARALFRARLTEDCSGLRVWSTSHANKVISVGTSYRIPKSAVREDVIHD